MGGGGGGACWHEYAEFCEVREGKGRVRTGGAARGQRRLCCCKVLWEAKACWRAAGWEGRLRAAHASLVRHSSPQELILDPKNLSTPADLEAAPGSHPNPLLSHGSGNSSSSLGSGGAACEEDAQARLARGGGAEPGGQPPHGAAGSSEAPAGLRAGVSALPPSASAPAQLEAMQRLAMSGDDHPLSNTSGSRWKAYFQVGGCCAGGEGGGCSRGAGGVVGGQSGSRSSARAAAETALPLPGLRGGGGEVSAYSAS